MSVGTIIDQVNNLLKTSSIKLQRATDNQQTVQDYFLIKNKKLL